MKKWGIEKKAKTSEMQHIIKIQNRRRLEDPGKETKFRIRQRPVEEAKIDRFKREHRELSTPSSSKFLSVLMTSSYGLTFAGTPSVISWRSPSPDCISPQEDEQQTSFREYHSLSSGSTRATNSASLEPATLNTLLDRELEELTHAQSISLNAQLPIPLTAGAQQREPHDQEQGSTSMEFTAAHHAATYGAASKRPSAMSTTFDEFPPLNQLDELLSYRHTIRPSLSQSSEILWGLVVSGNTFEEKAFNQKRLYEFESLKTEARLQGVQIDYVSGSKEGCDCSFCKITRLMDFFRSCVKARTTNRLDLCYRPNWLWCISEVCKMVLYRQNESNLRLLVTLTLICFSESLVIEARNFCQAAVLEFKSIEEPTLEHRDVALNLVAYLIFVKHLPEAKELLKDIARSSFDLLAEFNILDTHPLNANTLEEQQAFLVHRRAATQLFVIRYLEVNRATAHGISQQNTAVPDAANMSRMSLSDFSYSFCGNHKLYEQFILTGKSLEPYGDSYAFTQSVSTNHYRAIRWFCHWRFLMQNATFLGVFTSEGEHQ